MRTHQLIEVEGILKSALGGDIVALKQVAGGFTSRAFTFRHQDRDLVLRLSEYEQNFKKDELAAKFNASDLPIPKVLKIGSTADGFFAISERAFGRTIDQLTEHEMRQVLPSLLRAFDALRTADTSFTTGYGIWLADGRGAAASWREFLLDEYWAHPYVHGWEQVLDANVAVRTVYDSAYKLLSTNVNQCPELRHVVHGDLHNNMLFGAEQLTALFDWGSVMYGDFLYDLAWMSFWSPWHAATKNIDLRGEAQRHYADIGLEVPSFDARMLCYELSIGLDHLRFHAFTGELDTLAQTANRLNGIVIAGRGLEGMSL